MPSLTVEVADLWTQGPVLQVVLAPTRAAQRWMEEQNQPVPAGIPVQAMIDTGARRSYVKNGVLEPLGLHPVGLGAMHTASDHHVICPNYAVRIGFPHGALEVSVIQGPETGLFGETTQMLIGRDVLQYGLLVYMGQEGQFTLCF